MRAHCSIWICALATILICTNCVEHWDLYDRPLEQRCGVIRDKHSLQPVDSIIVTALVYNPFSGLSYSVDSRGYTDYGIPGGEFPGPVTDQTGRFCLEYDDRVDLCGYTVTDVTGQYRAIEVTLDCTGSLAELLPDVIYLEKQ